MKIYTKAGDQGYTKLGTGSTVHKSDVRVDAYGTVDELSSFIGLILSAIGQGNELFDNLLWIQRKLFVIGSILAFPGRSTPLANGELSTLDLISLENFIDQIEDELPILTGFILPGGITAAAYLHNARSICRRTERLVASLELKDYPLGENILPFLNRLSDYFFCAARLLNHRGGHKEYLALE